MTLIEAWSAVSMRREMQGRSATPDAIPMWTFRRRRSNETHVARTSAS